MNYKIKNNEMHSYFTNSFFIKSIYNPLINNKVRYFNITNVKTNPTVFWQEKLWGNFLVEINDQSIMLDNGEWDVRDNHAIDISLEEDDEEELASEEEELEEDLENEDEMEEDNIDMARDDDDLDDDDDDLDDLAVLDEEELDDGE